MADKIIVNGNKLRLYNSGNTESGSIKFDSGNISIQPKISSSGTITAKQITSSIASGTPPFSVSSNTVVTNLNSDLLDGKHSSDFLLLSGGIITGNLNVNGNTTLGDAPSDVITLTGQTTASNGVSSSLFNASIGYTSSTGYLKLGGVITASNIQLNNPLTTVGTAILQVDNNNIFRKRTFAQIVSDISVVPSSRTLTLGGTSNQISITPSGAQDLTANRSWTVGFPNDISILGSISVVTGYTSSTGYVKVGGDIISNNNLSSPSFISGFNGTGWMISKSTIPSNRYTAIFDDLWIRGSLNAYQMVINQIRATNGSLWISDAAKAISASYNSSTKVIVLKFQSSSYIPFVPQDIIRTKRWNFANSGNNIITNSVWDCITTISAINYAQGLVTISAPAINNNYTYTSSANGTWLNFASNISISGSQWVRIGSVNTQSRQGAIYLSSTDLGGPFLDIYNAVSSSLQGSNGNYNNVSESKLKLRLGNLSGLNLLPFGQMYDYGLYADNVYLRGTISATDGNFSGSINSTEGHIANWDIENNSLNNSQVYLGQSDFYSQDGDVFIGTVNDQSYINFGDKLVYNNGNLSVSGSGIFSGSVYANAGNFSGSITASSGKIGMWNIASWGLWGDYGNGKIQLSPSQALFWDLNSQNYIYITPQYGFQLFQQTNTSQILLGFIPFGDHTTSIFKISDFNNTHLLFTPQTELCLSGSITANSGYIGGTSGWIINTNKISSSYGIEFSNSTIPAIKIGANSYGSKGIWLGKGTDTNFSMSMYNDANNYLKWNGSSLQIKTNNFTLSSAGNISASNAILSGTIYANNGNFNGSITSSTGTIGGWNLTTDALTSGNTTISSKANSQSIKFTTASTIFNIDTSQNFIYLGKYNNNNYFYLVKDSTQYFKWDGNGLKIKQTNFTLSNGNMSASNAILGGTINALSGNIGGWNIDTYKLISQNSNIILSPQSPSPYIGICATSYTDEGIWIGSINEKSKFSIVNSGNTSKFLFDGNDIGISTSNFTLSQGNITAKNAIISGFISSSAGQIGGWNIDGTKLKSNDDNFVLDSTNKAITISSNNALRIGHFNLPPIQSISIITNNLDLSEFDYQNNLCPYWYSSITGGAFAYVSCYYNRLDFSLQGGQQSSGSVTWENAITGSIRFEQKIEYTAKITITQCQQYSDEAVFTFYIKSGAGIISSQSYTHRELAQMNAFVPHGIKLQKTQVISEEYSDLKFGVNWSGSPGTQLRSYPLYFYGGDFKILNRTPEVYLSHRGLHFQYGTTNKYIRLAESQGKLSNIQLDSQKFKLGYQGQFKGNSDTITLSLGSNQTTRLIATDRDIYMSGSNFKIENGVLSSSGGGGISIYHGLVGTHLANLNNAPSLPSYLKINTSGEVEYKSTSSLLEDIGAVSTSRIIIATSPLTGGGTLSSNISIGHSNTQGNMHLPSGGGSSRKVLVGTSTAGSGSWSNNINVSGTGSFASITSSNGIWINNALIINTQSVINSDNYTQVCTFIKPNLIGVFFDYVLYHSTSGSRAGSITAILKRPNDQVSFNEYNIVQTSTDLNEIVIDCLGKSNTNEIFLKIRNAKDFTASVLARGM